MHSYEEPSMHTSYDGNTYLEKFPFRQMHLNPIRQNTYSILKKGVGVKFIHAKIFSIVVENGL